MCQHDPESSNTSQSHPLRARSTSLTSNIAINLLLPKSAGFFKPPYFVDACFDVFLIERVDDCPHDPTSFARPRKLGNFCFRTVSPAIKMVSF